MVHALCMLDKYGKKTETHSEYVILITFPQPQWLRERTSIFRNTYTASERGQFGLHMGYPADLHCLPKSTEAAPESYSITPKPSNRFIPHA
jgi:hypothetical protein